MQENAFAICSAKGGVGKTSVSVNLGAAMASQGKQVVLIDGCMHAPDVSLHLGIPFYRKSLHDYFAGEADINDIVYKHSSGLHVIPSSRYAAEGMKGIKAKKIKELINVFKEERNWHVLVDSPAGLSKSTKNILETADKLLIVVNPELPAVVNAYKTMTVGKHLGVETHGVIVNRANRFRKEMNIKEIQHVLGRETRLLGTIPEHDSVPLASAKGNAVTKVFPHSPVSHEFHRFASTLTGVPYKKPGFFRSLMGQLF